MPKKSQRETVRGAYFGWLLGRRAGVYQADGRSNTHDAGRHSLGTRDRGEAIRLIQQLDLERAVRFGLADPSVLKQDASKLLPIEDGVAMYLQHAARPPILGGASRKTVARYKAVFDKFAEFACGENVRYWQQVTDAVAVRYCGWLDDEDYAGRTQYLELNTLKQAVIWLAREKL